MKRKMLLAKFGLLTIAAIGWSLAVSLYAQKPNEIASRLAENARRLRSYSWTMRIEVLVDGQSTSTSVEKVRYDIDGALQTTPLGGSGELTPELQQLVDGIASLALSYAQPDPVKFDRFFQQKASVWEGRGSDAGTTRMEGEGYLQSGDKIEIRGRNQRAESLEVTSSYAGTPLMVAADFRALPNDGPRFVARLVARHLRTGLELKMENFDHQYNQSVAAGDIAILPEGTELKVRLVQALHSGKNKTGQSFEAILDESVVLHSRTVLARGTRLTGTLVEVKGSGKVSGRAEMSLKLVSLESGSQQVPIQTNTLNFEAQGSKRRDARRIGGGTGIGAAIGAIAGGGSGAAKGAAIGAGIGVGATLLTKGKQVRGRGKGSRYKIVARTATKLDALSEINGIKGGEKLDVLSAGFTLDYAVTDNVGLRVSYHSVVAGDSNIDADMFRIAVNFGWHALVENVRKLGTP